MIEITEVIDSTKELGCVRIRGVFKTPPNNDGKYIMPKSYLVPERVWGTEITHKEFEYAIYLNK